MKKIKIIFLIILMQLLLIGVCFGTSVLNERVRAYKVEGIGNEETELKGTKYENINYYNLYKKYFISTVVLYTSGIVLLAGCGILLIVEYKSKEQPSNYEQYIADREEKKKAKLKSKIEQMQKVENN